MRATHLHKTKPEHFESLRQSLIKKQTFVHVEVLHQSSDIGLPYQIFVRHNSGKELYYDGVVYRLTETVHGDDFGLDEIEELAGYNAGFDPIIMEFEDSLHEVIPSIHMYSHTSLSFYTASPKSWEEIGIKAEGDPHLRLTCRDMNIFTITALIFSEAGKNYYVYLGERESTLQMLAHEAFISMELRNFSEFIEEKRKLLHIVKKATLEELNGIISPFYKLNLKHKNWNSIKISWKTLGEIRKVLAQFDLLTKNMLPTNQYWHFGKFVKSSSRDLFVFGSDLPNMCQYFDDPSILVFDSRKELKINYDHIVDDNFDRFPENIQAKSKYEIRQLLFAATDAAKEKVRRNYKIAVPQYYQNKVQLLLPLCLIDSNKADVALVVERITLDNGDYFYRGNTIFLLDWAYNSARQIAKPDKEWLQP